MNHDAYRDCAYSTDSSRARSVAHALVTLTACLLAMSCGGGTRGALEPRFVAVHNAMTAMGLSQSGSISEGSLPTGGTSRVDVQLHAGQCYTFMVFGTEGAENLDLSLVNAAGEELGRDTTHDREAALHACAREAGHHALTITMATGHGGYISSYWSAGSGAGGFSNPRGGHAIAAQGAGNCAEPIPLTVGTVTSADTRGGTSVMEGSCARGSAPERVFAFQVDARSQVSVTVESQFDGVVYITRQCGAPDAEVACNDDAGGTTRSQVQATLDPGAYFAVVDGYREQAGAFDVIVSVTEAPSVTAVCTDAPLLPIGQAQRGSTSGVPDSFQASCAGNARAPDRVFKISAPSASRLRVRQQSSYDGALHLRRTCEDASTELACNDDFGDSHHSMISGMLTPGDYYLIVDGYGGAEAGDFELNTELVAATGGNAAGDTCQQPEASPVGRQVDLDTIQAHDDNTGTCGGQGAADVVYQLNIAARSRVRATIENNEFAGALYLQSRCGDTGSEVTCERFTVNHKAPVIDTNVAPGQYVLVVDGATPNDFGAGRLNVQVDDLAALERVCRAAPQIRPGREERGSTALSSDRFQATCANNAQSNDAVYQLVVRRRSLAKILLTADYDSTLHLRGSCTEVSSEIACNDDQGDNRHSAVEAALDPGTYYVIVDGFRTGNQGNYTLNVQLDNL